MTATNAVALKELLFSAKIDYVTLENVSKLELGPMDGLCVWPRNHNGRRLTVHDPSPDDMRRLAVALPNATLYEMEVAVDVRPRRRHLTEEEYAACLQAVKSDYFAKRLMPQFPPESHSGFRGAYKPQPIGYKLQPFNHRVPGADEQHLHGSRHDSIQVKVYYKNRDNNQPLHWTKHVIRAEVRLASEGLQHHGLFLVSDLLDFRFRRHLSRYFRHVRGTNRAATRKRMAVAPVLRLVTEHLEQEDKKHWDRCGIGAFQRGGKRHAPDVRFSRDIEMNERIGQALDRLQGQHRSFGIVCSKSAANDEYSTAARLSA